MLQSFVPVLLLVMVALSSSNVLPIISANQLDTEQGYESQREDNIFSSNLYKLPDIQTEQLLQDYSDSNNNLYNYDDELKTDDENYGEGFRKEQWHNYPKQLDRLGLYKKYDDLVQHSLLLKPLLIFKMNPDYLVNDSVNDRDKISKLQSSKAIEKDDSDLVILERYPRKIQTTEKQHQENDILNDFGSAMDQKKIVKKRIFSLWSRLQSLSHRGHELQHRRHMYSLYGLSDSGGSGGTLTAETRAFMRPPGSPLRWG